jgi:hypothetical protein
VTVEMPDDLRPQIIYPGVVDQWIAQEVSERMSFMAGDTTYETKAESPLRA